MKICNQCQAINADGAQFCSKCGAQLGASLHGGQQRGYQPQPQHHQQQYQPQSNYQQQSQYQHTYQPQQPNMPKPYNNMVWAILTTIFCCLPFGIISIVKASSVDRLYNSGDYNGAYEAAKSAKQYAITSAILGLIGFVLSFLAGMADAM